MVSALAASLRSFQASVLSGGMLVFTVYIFFGERIGGDLEEEKSLLRILDLSKHAPLIALLLLVLLIGSLYTTALEGLVDWLQRRNLDAATTVKGPIRRRALAVAAPLSESSLRRLRSEAGAFFREAKHSSAPTPEEVEFVDAVVRDTLWMDGKLVGTPLLEQYRTFRSEGEIDVSAGLLLAPTTAAVTVSAGFQNPTVVILTVAAALGGLKLVDYGFYYYRRANSLIAHHVADGAVLTPTMESLVRNDPALRPSREVTNTQSPQASLQS